jgi:hypothetical protein
MASTEHEMASTEHDPTVNGEATRQRSIGELTRAVSKDAADLVRAEIDLAKQEVSWKMKQSAVGGGLLAVAAVLVVTAVGALTATAILALATAIDAWLAALIVTVVLLLIAAVLAMVGAGRLRAASPPVPVETAESAKEDLQWLKRQTSERR